MYSTKEKRRQTLANQKGTNEMDTSTTAKQKQPIHNTQKLLNQPPNQKSDNDGNEDEEHSDGAGSQRSWSPVIKPRRRFSASEIQHLEAEYARDINPSTDQLEIIAQTIGTTRRVITTWFQNHRAKGKRNSASMKNTNKRTKHVHAIASTTNNNGSKSSRIRKRNLTQDDMIGPAPGPSCHCINQATADDDGYNHPIFPTTSTNSAHVPISDTMSPLHMNDPTSMNAYDSSYFAPDPTAAIDVPFPLTIAAATPPWNHAFYPAFSIQLPSSSSFTAWSQSPPGLPPVITNPCHYLNTRPASLISHSPLPQCCVDELYTGYPCPFHTLYL